MKKILLFIMLFILFTSNAFASSLSTKIVSEGSEKKLLYYEDDILISYSDASKRYNVNKYISMVDENITYYFCEGKQISYDDYIIGIDEEDAIRRVKNYGNKGILVSSTEDIISVINDLYKKFESNQYHLVYSKKSYNEIDFEYIKSYVIDNYVIDKSVNTFKYRESGIYNYPREMFFYNEYEMVVDVISIIDENEELLLREFLKTFIGDIKNKSEYEKVLYTYMYLSKTVENSKEKNYISAYDALILRKSSKIGFSNAFQLIMENLGIDSYIVSNYEYSKDNYIVTDTFNIVKLDNKWYKIETDKDSFLTGDNIKLSNGIKLSENSYFNDHNDSKNISINYEKYDKIVLDISKKRELMIKYEDIKKVDFISYIVLIIILLFLTFVIIRFTRRD